VRWSRPSAATGCRTPSRSCEVVHRQHARRLSPKSTRARQRVVGDSRRSQECRSHAEAGLPASALLTWWSSAPRWWRQRARGAGKRNLDHRSGAALWRSARQANSIALVASRRASRTALGPGGQASAAYSRDRAAHTRERAPRPRKRLRCRTGARVCPVCWSVVRVSSCAANGRRSMAALGVALNARRPSPLTRTYVRLGC
jgi:hypothetical protein